MRLTTTEAINRGYNLMIAAFLFAAGLAFGTVGFVETDTPDKIDDFGLLIVGLIAVAWYLFGGSRLRRTAIAPALVLIALVLQLVGVVLENDDATAFGDNIGGTLLFVTLTGIALWQWIRGPRSDGRETA